MVGLSFGPRKSERMGGHSEENSVVTGADEAGVGVSGGLCEQGGTRFGRRAACGMN